MKLDGGRWFYIALSVCTCSVPAMSAELSVSLMGYEISLGSQKGDVYKLLRSGEITCGDAGQAIKAPDCDIWLVSERGDYFGNVYFRSGRVIEVNRNWTRPFGTRDAGSLNEALFAAFAAMKKTDGEIDVKLTLNRPSEDAKEVELIFGQKRIRIVSQDRFQGDQELKPAAFVYETLR